MLKKIFLLLLVSLGVMQNILCMEQGSSRKRAPSFSVDFKKDTKKQRDSSKKPKEAPQKESKEEVDDERPEKNARKYEISYQQSPGRIKAFIRAHLMKKKYARSVKHLLLAGRSGVGKTTLSLAIAYKLNREAKFISAPDLLAHYRDQATENIRDLFDQLALDYQNKKKPVLILDEINMLTDDHVSEHSDTKHTASELWTKIDRFKDLYDDFLLIATTNITKKMPHQLQSRFKGKTVMINNPTPEACKQSIEFLLQDLDISKDETCDDAYLTELATKMSAPNVPVNPVPNNQPTQPNQYTQRDIESAVTLALWLYDIDHPEGDPVLSREYLDRAFQQLQQEDQTLWDFEEHATAEDRRHAQLMVQNERLNQENREVQIKLGEASMLANAYVTGMQGDTFADGVTDNRKSSIMASRIQRLISFIFPARAPYVNAPQPDNECNIM